MGKQEKDLQVDKLKKDYEIMKVKYNLPSFAEMNEEFEIEKAAEKETDFLLRDIRRFLLDKSTSYMRFLESFMNPASAPFLFMFLSKSLAEKDRKIINDLYFELGKYVMQGVDADNEYSEKKEAQIIKEVFENWKIVKEKMSLLLKNFESSWENKRENKGKNYIS